MSKNIIRLPLEKAYNVRDLGGYATENDNITAFRTFLRGDNLTNLTEADKQYLINYGVTSVIDLRSEEEANYKPNPFHNHETISYINVSLFPFVREEVESMDAVKEFFAQENALAIMYNEMLARKKAAIKTIFEFIADNEGCILFHCAQGKDRTGVLALLLLGLASVSRSDIIANYVVTEIYNEDNPDKRIFNLPIETPEVLLNSKPENIAQTYDYLIDNYGNFEKYLLATGLDKEVINKVKERLLGTASK